MLEAMVGAGQKNPAEQGNEVLLTLPVEVQKPALHALQEAADVLAFPPALNVPAGQG